MLGRKVFTRSQLLLLSVALLFATVFGDEDAAGVHHVHTSSVKGKDGSTSESVSSTTTGSSPSSLPDFLKSLNLQFAPESGVHLAGTPDKDGSGSSISSATSSATNINGARGIPGGYNYPSPPGNPPPSIPPGGGFPGYPWGFPWGGGLSKHLDLDVSGGGGLLGGFLPYFPIVEKVVLVIGGGLLLLALLVILKIAVAKGGFLNTLGSSISNAFAGAGSVDLGPFHASAVGSAAAGGGRQPAFVNDPNFNQRVMDGVERKF